MVKKRTDIAKVIADKLDVNIYQAKECVEAILDNMMEWVANGDSIQLRNFGVLYAQERDERKARNISKGTTVVVPAQKKPKFKPSSVFLDKCNG